MHNRERTRARRPVKVSLGVDKCCLSCISAVAVQLVDQGGFEGGASVGLVGEGGMSVGPAVGESARVPAWPFAITVASCSPPAYSPHIYSDC